MPMASAFEESELIAEFEVVEDVLDVGGEAVQIVLEIGQQLLLAAARFQIAQGKLRGVVEGLASGIAKRRALLGDTAVVEHLLGVEHLLLGRLEHRVHAPDDTHRQDHVRIFAALEEVAQDIISDAPDERDNPIVRGLIHNLICHLGAYPETLNSKPIPVMETRLNRPTLPRAATLAIDYPIQGNPDLIDPELNHRTRKCFLKPQFRHLTYCLWNNDGTASSSSSQPVRLKFSEHRLVNLPSVKHRIRIPPEITWRRRRYRFQQLSIGCSAQQDAGVTVPR